MSNQSSIELMSPAGSEAALTAAINAGADSVYFGVGKLNMRARSADFTLDDLPAIAARCRDAGRGREQASGRRGSAGSSNTLGGSIRRWLRRISRGPSRT